jgi:hypothetical protein
MKVSFFHIATILFCFVNFQFFGVSNMIIEAKTTDASATQINENVQNWYATTGVTRGLGPNYSINVRVQGTQGFNGCVIFSEVQVSSGYGWSSTMYSQVIGEDCTYFVNVGGKSYYFRI